MPLGSPMIAPSGWSYRVPAGVRSCAVRRGSLPPRRRTRRGAAADEAASAAKLRNGCENGRKETLHVGGAAAIEPARLDAKAEGIARPAGLRRRDHVHMAGEDVATRTSFGPMVAKMLDRSPSGPGRIIHCRCRGFPNSRGSRTRSSLLSVAPRRSESRRAFPSISAACIIGVLASMPGLPNIGAVDHAFVLSLDINPGVTCRNRARFGRLLCFQ